MRWIVAVVVFWLVLFFCTPRVWAESPAVVLRGMSAVPIEGSEWIALENTTPATISGQIWSVRDVQGSVKTWLLPSLQPYELRMFSSTETKISLNNTGDQVELLQGNVVVQSSSPYEELQAGDLWVLLSDGWQKMDADEWLRRWPVRDWQAAITPVSPIPQVTTQPSITSIFSPTPTTVPLVTPKAMPVPSVPLKNEDWWENVSLSFTAQVSSSSAAIESAPPIWERPPGNFDDQWQTFQDWKRQIWYRLAVTFSASFLVLALCAPKLYRCYNDLCLLDDG